MLVKNSNITLMILESQVTEYQLINIETPTQSVLLCVGVFLLDELMLYLRIFSDGITIAYSEKFKAVANEMNNKDNITPK